MAATLTSPACASASTSAGRLPIRCARRRRAARRGGAVDACGPVRGRDDGGRRDGVDGARSARSRTARPWRRTRCSSAAARGLRLVTTEGFRDVIEIGRQTRPSLYDLTQRPPDGARPARAPVHGPRARHARTVRRCRSTRPTWRPCEALRTRGRGVRRGLPPVLLPRPGPRARASARHCGSPCRSATSRCRATCCPSSGVRALSTRGRRLPLAPRSAAT